MSDEITNPFQKNEWITSADGGLKIHVHSVRGNRAAYTVFEYDPDQNEYWEVGTYLGEWEDIPVYIEEWENELAQAAEAVVTYVDFRGPMK